MEPIGYGIIGAGVILPNHAIAVQKLRDDGVELIAIADIDADRARLGAESFGALAWYTDYHDLLAREDVHVVSICLPHHLHKDVVLTALNAGKHVICEKPLTTTTEDADEIIAAARKTDVYLSVIFQHRYDRSYQQLHRAVKNGAFGQVLAAQVFHKSAIRPRSDQMLPWRYTHEAAGGGVFIMQTIHYLDILLWSLGRVESVAALVDTLARDEPVEDSGAAVLRFENGAIGSVVTTNASRTEWRTRIEVHGTTGAAVVENNEFVRWEPSSHYVDDGEYTEEPELTPVERELLDWYGTGHIKQIADFVTHVRNGLPPAVTAEDGRYATAVIQAFYESSRTGQSVSVS